ncbi:MAG: phosphatidylinositol-specific phospholipase C1-like protein [Deltaproteobacteria bacterium]|nr:MAG: phosphatidylinositol-specific phospholipase C1-like protein [Deltaproteobacteria bacterium]
MLRRPAHAALIAALLIAPASAALADDDRARCRKLGEAIEAGGADAGAIADFAEACVHLNQVQVLGSHNSYHEEPAPQLQDLIASFNVPGCGEPGGPPCGSDLAIVWEYSHIPLAAQFATQGIRQVELDVFADPDGGLFALPLGSLLAPLDPPHDPDGLLFEPGFKVLHVQDLDFRSSCLTLALCLEEIQQWSAANPRHLPLTVLIELKEEPLPEVGLPFVVPLLFEAEDLDALDELIRSIFPPHQLITPDDVRGRQKSLEQAVLKRGWPALEEARGRVLFALDNGGELRDLYIADHPSLRDRVLFTDSPAGTPEAAFMKRNGPEGRVAEIQELVAKGYIVRTRADADTIEARLGYTSRRDAALASGAQFVSTDYPVPDPDFGTGYLVEIPGGAPGRCNPVNAPPGCRNTALEAVH